MEVNIEVIGKHVFRKSGKQMLIARVQIVHFVYFACTYVLCACNKCLWISQSLL